MSPRGAEEGEARDGALWVPFELSVGLPLYTVEACAAVCAGVAREGLLEPERMNAFGAQSAHYSAELRAFVDQIVRGELPQPQPTASPDALPVKPPAPAGLERPAVLPRRPLAFDGQRLRELELESDF